MGSASVYETRIGGDDDQFVFRLLLAIQFRPSKDLPSARIDTEFVTVGLETVPAIAIINTNLLFVICYLLLIIFSK